MADTALHTVNDLDARFPLDAGIAIGPILFIIAILGILAAAVAAGSGSFTSSTTNEASSTKASAIIEIGNNLKTGFDRVTIGENGVAFANVVISVDHTDATTDLFSPIGGGIAAPSVSLSNDPGTDVWHYPLIAVPGIGTSLGSRVALLHVSSAVCDQVNLKAASLAAGMAHTDAADLGDFASAGPIASAATNWPSDFKGKSVGCVENTDHTTLAAGYFFYQVIGIQ
jgi:hypothetical protein